MTIDIKTPQIDDIVAAQIRKIEDICKEKKPLVAIHCLAYNHEPYIRDAIEGFLMQKTTFPFVVIVHEDNSTDGTREILREYSKKYQDVIIPIFEIENQYSKGGFSLISTVMNKAIDATGAKYIAMCEGDDYWIDRNKLQRQVDILDSDKKLLLVFHNALIRWENHDRPDKIMCDFSSGYFSINDIFRKWQLPLASVLFDKDVLNTPTYSKLNMMYPGIGYNYFIAAAKSGKVYGLSECLSVYRKNNGGVSNSLTQSTCLLANYSLEKAVDCKMAIIYETNKNKKLISLSFINILLHRRYEESKKILSIVWQYDKTGYFLSAIYTPISVLTTIFSKILNRDNTNRILRRHYPN